MAEGPKKPRPSDVRPVLSIVLSAEDLKKNVVDETLQEPVSAVPSLRHISETKEEKEVQENPEENAPPEEEPTRDPEPEPTPPPKPEGEVKPKAEEETAPPYQFNLPKKKRVQVDPNATVNEVGDNAHYLTSLPVVPESDVPYVPILYTFRVKTKGNLANLKHLKTKPPPFYLQFDHAIAVIWTLFSKAEKSILGIAQLQWALHFLQSIFTAEGGHARDVQLCIDTIQDYLVERYAQMSGEAVIYCPSKFSDFHRDPERKKVTGPSVNYTLVEEKYPLIPIESKASAVLDQQLLDELENVKKVVGIDSIDLTNVVSKEQVMDILHTWKREQMEKIQDELSLLYVVEDMMKNSDSQHFEGYTDESQFEGVFRKKN